MTDSLLTFFIRNQIYAVPLNYVHHILPAVEITPFPDTPPEVAGIINFHGEIIPIFDVSTLLHHPQETLTPSHQFLILEAPGHHVGVIINQVKEVLSLRAIKDIDTKGPQHSGELIDSVFTFQHQLIFQLNPEKLFAISKEISVVKTQEVNV